MKNDKARRYSFAVRGFETIDDQPFLEMKKLQIIMTIESRKKTLSINNGKTQFTIPLEPILAKIKES